MNRREFILDFARRNFEDSGNPCSAWDAINLCTKHNMPFPPWVVAYLKECSERMKSKAQTSDLRKVLPSILGFPKKKSGPGKPLHPSLGKQLDFLIQFAILINKGESALDARRNAFNAVFDRRAADPDDKTEDKTLMRWVLKGFSLKEAPKDIKQWQDEARNFLMRLWFVCAKDGDDVRKLIEMKELATKSSSAIDKELATKFSSAIDNARKFDAARNLIDLDDLATELSKANEYTKRLPYYHLP